MYNIMDNKETILLFYFKPVRVIADVSRLSHDFDTPQNMLMLCVTLPVRHAATFTK